MCFLSKVECTALALGRERCDPHEPLCLRTTSNAEQNQEASRVPRLSTEMERASLRKNSSPFKKRFKTYVFVCREELAGTGPQRERCDMHEPLRLCTTLGGRGPGGETADPTGPDEIINSAWVINNSIQIGKKQNRKTSRVESGRHKRNGSETVYSEVSKRDHLWIASGVNIQTVMEACLVTQVTEQ